MNTFFEDEIENLRKTLVGQNIIESNTREICEALAAQIDLSYQ